MAVVSAKRGTGMDRIEVGAGMSMAKKLLDLFCWTCRNFFTAEPGDGRIQCPHCGKFGVAPLRGAD